MKKQFLKSLVICLVLVMILSGCEFPAADIETSSTVSTEIQAGTSKGTSGSSETECSGTAVTEEDQHTVQSSEGLCNDTDVESNINSEKLSEDVKLTNNAEVKDQTEKDTLIEATTDTQDSNVENNIKVIQKYNTQLPPEVVTNIKYTKYPVAADYLLINTGSANIRELPTSQARKIGNVAYFEKITVLALVQGEKSTKYNTDKWYKVVFKKGDETAQGYILSSLAVLRTFQFQRMYQAVTSLKQEVDANKTAYVNNYKNRIATPPLYHGSTVDAYGILRYQAAPAYVKADTKSEFRYIPDGTLVTIIGDAGTFYKIRTLNFKGEYYVPRKYLSQGDSIDNLTKVIVVDRKNQNEGVFEYIDGKWNIISYTYATTGELAKYKEPTPLGYFMAIQKRDTFLYLDDVTKQVSGYAPYAIRFSGGAYIHGVPVDVKIENGVPVFPPMQEYLYTIGTVPRSHKCVRNYTSHALFLYQWIEIGKSSVIVIE